MSTSTGQFGGILSQTRKRRLQEAMLVEKERQEKWELDKKYTGPVGKNPWGAIAEDWTGKNRGAQLDYATELEMFRGMLPSKKKAEGKLLFKY